MGLFGHNIHNINSNGGYPINSQVEERSQAEIM